MIISRISLIGEPSFTVPVPHGSPESPNLLVISGPNGSGKTLATLALEAAFAAEDKCHESAAAVLAAGVERVEVDFEHQGWAGQVSFPLPDGPRSVEWQRLQSTNGHDPATEDKPQDIPPDDLFFQIHLVRSGQLAVPAFEFLCQSALRAKRTPMDADLNHWCDIERELAGEEGKSGRLGVVRELRDSADANLQRVLRMHQEFADARSRGGELAMRVSDALAQRDILTAEAAELNKACSFADRAMRLDTWVAEIRQEGKAVQRLREQHAELQESLDALESRLRGAPEEFPTLLEDFDTLVRRERELQDKTAETRDHVDRLKAELQELDSQLHKLAAPDLDDLAARRDWIARETDAANLQITELMHDRIELVRQREGLEQHLRRKFQAFLELSPELRTSLDQYLSLNGHSKPEPVVYEPAPADDPEPFEVRAAAIRARLRQRYEGYELLPTSMPNMLREFFDLRHTFGTLSSDLEGLKARSAHLRGKTRQARSIGWSIATGFIGFGAATEMFAWDIGLFAGLVVSLGTLLTFQYAHRRTESEIESALSAEAMTQRRYDAVRDSMGRLEKVLKPILHATSVEDAMVRLGEFQSLLRELGDVESTLAEIRAARIAPRTATVEDIITLPDLPEALAHIPAPVLRQLHSEFIVLEQQLTDLNAAWINYADGGAYAEKIRVVEERISSLHQEQSQIAVEIERRNQTYLSQHNNLLERRSTIEEALTQAENTSGEEGELKEIKERLAALDREVGGLLRNADLDVLRAEWRDREALRARLREIRDALSARQTQDELRAREMLLSEELAQVRQRLLELDPLYLLQGTPSEYSSKYAGQLKAVRDDISTADDEMKKVQAEITELDIEGRSAALAAERPLDELREIAADAVERYEAVQRELAAVRIRIADVHHRLSSLDAVVAGELAEAINQQVIAFSEGRLQEAQCREGQWIAVAADGSVRALRNLSDGTSDLIYLAIRIAVLEYLHDHDECPLVWDEALSRLDERHLTNVRVALVKLAAQRQVLLFTRHTSFEWWGPSFRLVAPRRSVFDM